MKKTKKVTMIPVDELEAIMSRLSKVMQPDPLRSEKTGVDAQIMQTLQNPKIDPQIKSKKVQFLRQKRRQLKREIENRPQRVLVVNEGEQKEQTTPSTLQPYQGLAKKKEEVQSSSEGAPASSEYSTSFASASSELETTGQQSPRRKRKHPLAAVESPRSPIINAKYHDELLKHIKQNADHFNIDAKGQFFAYNGGLIKDSNYSKVIDFMTGKTDEKPKGYLFLYSKLLKDDKVKKMVAESKKQTSKGKKQRKLVAVRIKEADKLPFVFKPRIWAKIVT